MFGWFYIIGIIWVSCECYTPGQYILLIIDQSASREQRGNYLNERLWRQPETQPRDRRRHKRVRPFPHATAEELPRPPVTPDHPQMVHQSSYCQKGSTLPSGDPG